MIAEVADSLATGIRDSLRPVARLGIQDNAGGLHTGCRQNHGFTIDFDLLLRVAIDVSHTFRAAVLVNEDIFTERISAQVQIAALFSRRQEKPRRGEKRADVTAFRAIRAVVARWMASMRNG